MKGGISISSVEFRHDTKIVKRFNAQWLRKFLEIVNKFGVHYVELWYPEFVDSSGVDEAKKLLNEFDIEAACVSNWISLVGDESEKEIVKTLDIAEKIGSSFVMGYVGEYKSIGLEAAVKKVISLIEEAEKRKCTLLAEGGHGGLVDLSTHLNFLEKAKGLKICFDQSIFVYRKIDYKSAIEALKDYIVYTHFQNDKYDVEGYLKSLDSNKYAGFVTIEPHVQPMPPWGPGWIPEREKPLLEALQKQVLYLRTKGLK